MGPLRLCVFRAAAVVRFTSSSMETPGKRISSVLACAGCVLLALAFSHAGLELVSRFAEVRLDAYPWQEDGHRQVLTSTNYTRRGEDWMMLYGPSEAREAFLVARMDKRLPIKTYQNAHTMGTVRDFSLFLRYLEEVYGAKALPKRLLLAVSMRMVCNLPYKESPLFTVFDRYSPYFKVDRESEVERLVRKTPWESLVARYRLLARQGHRYRNALKAIAKVAKSRLQSGPGSHDRTRPPFVSVKFHHKQPWSHEQIRSTLTGRWSFWRALNHFDFSKDGAAVRAGLRNLATFFRERGIEVYVVNMPESSWNRELYDPHVYEAYFDMVRTEFAGAPLLDLRTLLGDGEFYDMCHPTFEGAERVTAAVIEFLEPLLERGRGS